MNTDTSISCNSDSELFRHNPRYLVDSYTVRPKVQYILNPLPNRKIKQYDCGNGVYINNKWPKHGLRNSRIPLDKYLSSDVLDGRDMYTNENLVNYGRHYSDYSDMIPGAIRYRTETMRGHFPSPVFNQNHHVSTNIYKDPMDRFTPEPVMNVKCDDRDDDCLSFIHDTTMHRQDLMSLQRRGMDSSSRTRR